MAFMSVKPAPQQVNNDDDIICSTMPPAEESFDVVITQEAQKATRSRVAAMLARAKPEETK